MKDKCFVEIDAGPWLTCDGDIEVSVYIGEGTGEPSYTDKLSLIELVDRELESMIPGIIPESNKTSNGSIAKYHFDDVKRLLKNLKKTYKYAEKRAKKLGYE